MIAVAMLLTQLGTNLKKKTPHKKTNKKHNAEHFPCELLDDS